MGALSVQSRVGAKCDVIKAFGVIIDDYGFYVGYVFVGHLD